MATEGSKRLAKAFSVLIGIVMVAFGAAMLAGGIGTGPCGASCGLFQTFIQLLGQPLFNLLFGMLWVIVGGLFVTLPLLRGNASR